MATVRDVVDALERLAPRRHALDGDNVGLQVGDPDHVVERVVVALDRSLAAIRFASESGAQMLVTHHPLIFSPIATVTSETTEGRAISALIRADMAFAAAHTNWDAAYGGVNDALADRLGLSQVRSFGEAAEVRSLKLVFFCPESSVDTILDAVTQAGAGQIGGYGRCAFSSTGMGTFEAGVDASPTVGRAGKRNDVEEVRVETVVPASRMDAVKKALFGSHPYETPAYDFLTMAPVSEQPLGRIGTLDLPLRLRDFVRKVDTSLATRCLAWGDPDRTIRTVAAVGGSADGEWRDAQQAGADVLVTGEVRQHNALEAFESNFAIISAGHYATENPGAMALASGLQSEVPGISVLGFEPKPGFAGRPFTNGQ